MPSIKEPVLHFRQTNAKDMREQPGHYRLLGSRCKRCGEIFFPQRWACFKCHSNELEDYQLKPKGTVISSSLRRALRAEEKLEIHQAVIKLEDGPTIAAEIVEATPDKELDPGTPVEMVVRKIGRNSLGLYLYCYKFRPVTG